MRAEAGHEQSYVDGYHRGYAVATARAESRRRLGLPIEPTEHKPADQGYEQPEQET